MKINAKKELLNLEGEKLTYGDKNLTLGVAIAEVLLSQTDGGNMKTYILGIELAKEANVEVDTADLAIIKSHITSTKRWPNLVSGQILVILEKLKDDK